MEDEQRIKIPKYKIRHACNGKTVGQTKPSIKQKKSKLSSQSGDESIKTVVKKLTKEVMKYHQSLLLSNEKFQESAMLWYNNKVEHAEVRKSLEAVTEVLRQNLPHLLCLLPSFQPVPDKSNQFEGTKPDESQETEVKSNGPVNKFEFGAKMHLLEKEFYQLTLIFQEQVPEANEVRKRAFIDKLKIILSDYESKLKDYKDLLAWQLKTRSDQVTDVMKIKMKKLFANWVEDATKIKQQMQSILEKCERVWFLDSTAASCARQSPIDDTLITIESSSSVEYYNNMKIPNHLPSPQQLHIELVSPLALSDGETTLSAFSDTDAAPKPCNTLTLANQIPAVNGVVIDLKKVPVLDDLVTPVKENKVFHLEAARSNKQVPVLEDLVTPVKENEVFYFQGTRSYKETVMEKKLEPFQATTSKNQKLDDTYIIDSMLTVIGNELSCSDSAQMRALEPESDVFSLTSLGLNQMPGSSSAQHMPQLMYSCQYCQELFDSIDSMSAHISLTHSPRVCGLCSKACPDIKALQQHVHKHHCDFKVCLTCGVTENKHNFQTHQEMHNLSPYKCLCCSTVLGSEEELKIHSFQQHKDLYHTCDHCDFLCDTRYELNRHKISHIRPELTTHTCQICSTFFETATSLNRHLKVTHQRQINERPAHIVCIICNLECPSKQSLIEHIKTVHNQNIKVLRAHGGDDATNLVKDQCHVCDRYFRNTIVKAVHLLIHHEVNPFNCPCGEEFSLKAALDFHILNHTKLEEARYKLKPTRGRRPSKE